MYGLTHTLSVKFVQDDLHVVSDLELSSSHPDHLLSLATARGWSSSVLFVDTEDEFPENITIASQRLPNINLMPVYGLNVSSMIKHQTLVLTERAVKENIVDSDLPASLHHIKCHSFFLFLNQLFFVKWLSGKLKCSNVIYLENHGETFVCIK